MQNIDSLIQEDLIARSCEFLKDKSIKAHNFEKPMYPACIFYLSERSVTFYDEMNNDLIRGWGEAARHIRHFKVTRSDDFFGSVSDMENNMKSVKALQSEITDMMSDANVFRDMNYIHMYFLLDTSALSTEEFERWYACVREIVEQFTISKRTFLITILNQSLDNTDASVGIRQKLLELYVSDRYSESRTHLYDSVFLFSNRLKNGQFIKLSGDAQEYEDYNLFADIVLLTDTFNAQLSDRINKLCSKRVPAFTAAYSNLAKPIGDIVMITLKKCLMEIRRSIESHEQMSASSDSFATQLLGISNNNFKAADEIFLRFVLGYVCNTEPLRYLPCESDVADMKFQEANAASMGCLELFVQQNYLSYIDDLFASHSGEFRQRLKAEILEKLTFEQQKTLRNYKGNIEADVQSAISRLIISPEPSDTAVGDYINTVSKNRVIECLIPIMQEIIVGMRENSRNSLSVFARLYAGIELLNTTGDGGLRQNINHYYESIVEDYYRNPHHLDKITKKILSECGDESGMIEALREELENIFSDNPVFGVSFVDELITRNEALGTAVNIGTLITKELVERLDDRLALNSYNVFNERFFEAYFLNTDQNSVYDALREKAKSHHIPVTYYNTLSNEMVETVWFYKCTEDNIRI